MATSNRRFVQRNVRLECGKVLTEVETAYLTRGELAANGRNAILITHGYTSGPDMIAEGSDTAEGSWSDIVGPGRPVDTDRFYVVCPNALGSSFGSTNAASIDPSSGRPYGSTFPDITMGDIVSGQRALLDSLGVTHLAAVIGPSFGGAQVFQWGVDYPGAMDALVPVLAAPAMPQANVAELEAKLAADPSWHGGDYYDDVNGMVEHLSAMRVGTLTAYGIETVLAERFPDAGQRTQEIRRLARTWAETFDANSLLILLKAIARFDVTNRLDRIRAPVLYVLSRSDRMFPPTLAPEVMAQLESEGVDARYFEIASEHGHIAASTDAFRWAPVLRAFIAETSARAARGRS